MKPERKLADAIAAFKAADAELAKLELRATEASQRLLQANLDLAAVERETEQFARGDVAASAVDLAAKKAQAGGAIELLERAADYLAREAIEQKAKVLEAEQACLTLQREQAAQALAAGVDDFLARNAAELQRLTALMHADSLFSNAADSGVHGAKHFVRRHIEVLFDEVFSAAVQRLWGDDDHFRAGCVPKASAVEFVLSKHITISERTTARSAGAMRGHAGVIAALTPAAPECATPLDLEFAMQSARDAARSAEHHRFQVEHCRTKLQQRPGDPGWLEHLRKHEEAVTRFDSIVAAWDEKLMAHRAAA